LFADGGYPPQDSRWAPRPSVTSGGAHGCPPAGGGRRARSSSGLPGRDPASMEPPVPWSFRSDSLGAPAAGRGSRESSAARAQYGEAREAPRAPYGEARDAPRAPYADGTPPRAPYGDQSSSRAPYGDQSSARAPYGEQPSARTPHGDQSAPRAPYTDSSPFGDASSSRAPYSDRSQFSDHSSRAPYGEMRDAPKAPYRDSSASRSLFRDNSSARGNPDSSGLPGEPEIAQANASSLRPKDQAAVMELYRDAFAEENANKEKRGLKTTNSLPSETAFGFVFSGKGMLVARIGGQIVGVVTVERDRSHNCWIRCLAVNAGVRRKGLGSKLLAAALASFPGPEHRISYWEGRGQGLGAFYQRHGFKALPYSGEPEYVDMVRIPVQAKSSGRPPRPRR